MITVSSGRTTTQALISGATFCALAAGRWNPKARPPPRAVETFRNSRRVVMAGLLCVDLAGLRRGMDRGADPRISAAAADVGHRLVDVLVGRIGVLAQQRDRREDLPALAVAALGHLALDPGLLPRWHPSARREAFEGQDALSRRR